MDKIHTFNLKIQYGAFSSFGTWNPVVLNSKIFYLLFCILTWTPAPYYRLLLSFIHLASPNQLLSAPCFYQSDAQHISCWDSKSWCHCVFSSSVIAFILTTKHIEILFSCDSFFPIILLQTLPQIQYFLNYI